MSSEKKHPPQAQRVIDPSDPLHDSIEDLLKGMSGAEVVDFLNKLLPPKTSPKISNAASQD